MLEHLPDQPLVVAVGASLAPTLAAFAVAQRNKFRFVHAPLQAQALNLLLSETPLAFLVEHDPPECDALDFLRSIHRDKPDGKISALVLSDLPLRKDEQARALGLREVLPRAAHSDDLAWALDNLVETARLRIKVAHSGDAGSKKVPDDHERSTRFLDALTGGAWIKDLEGRFVFVNRAFCWAFGASPEFLIGRRTGDFLSPEHGAKMEENDRKALALEQGAVTIEPVKLASGPDRQMLVNRFAIRDDEGRPEYLGAIALDVTPGLWQFIDRSPLGAAMFDRNMRLLAASPKWWRVLDAVAPLTVGADARDIASSAPLDWDGIGARVRAGETIAHNEISFSATDRNRWLKWSAYAWTDHNSLVGGVVMTVEDITEAKAQEAERAALEQGYRSFFENAAFGAAEISGDGRIVRVNKRLCDMAGYPPADLIGRFVAELVHPDARASYLVARRAFYSGDEKAFTQGARFLCGDGTSRSVRITARAVRDADGKALYSTGIIEDITEQLEAETALRESEERYRVFFNNGAFGAVEVGLDGIITKVNKSLRDIGKWSEDDMVGHRTDEFFVPESREVFLAARATYLQGESEALNRVWRVQRKDGSIAFVKLQLTLMRDKDGCPIYSCGAVADVTEQIKAEEAVRQSEERYRVFFNNGAFGAIEADPEGTILRVNKWICDFGGFSPEDLVGRRVDEFTHPDDRANYLAARSSFIGGQRDGVNRVWRFRRKSGEYNALRVQASMVRDAEGRHLYTCGIAEDITEELAAQEALRASEARYRAFFDNGAFGALEADLDARLTNVNQFIADLGGYRREEMIGRLLLEFVHPEDSGAYRDTHAKLLRGEIDTTVETRRFKCKDGDYICIRFRPILLRDAKGKPAYLCAIAEDISEEIKAQVALRESEERLRKLSDNIPNSAVYTLRRGRSGAPKMLYVSAGVEKLTGVKPEEVMNNVAALLEMVLPSHRGAYIEGARASMENMSDFCVELPLIRRDGQLCWVRMHSRPTRLQDGSIVWDGVQTDITERKLAEIALARNETLLNAVLDGAQDGVLSVDDTGEIQSVNAAAAAMFGYGRQELLGKQLKILCGDYIRSGCDESQNPAGKLPLMSDGLPRITEGARKDGSRFPIEVRSARSHVEDAPLYVNFVRDLSERRTIEARIELLKEQRLAAMGGMAAALAHELNQPLAAILLHVETAQRLARLAPETRPFSLEESLAEAVTQTLRAGEIISHLRQFAARGEPDKSIQSLHALMREVCAAAPVHGPGRIALRLEAENDTVFIDKVQIKQVAFNLIRNAFEAMRDASEPVLTISTRTGEDNLVLVDFADSGPGISDEVKERLFEPLTTTKPTGMGIGLSLSRAIAAIHSGALGVASNAAGGATFTLSLPLHP